MACYRMAMRGVREIFCSTELARSWTYANDAGVGVQVVKG